MDWASSMKIKILGRELQLEVTDKIKDDGIYEPYEKKILINKKLSEEFRKRTIVHEELHAVFDLVGLGHSNISDDTIHIIIESVVTYLFSTYDLKRKK